MKKIVSSLSLGIGIFFLNLSPATPAQILLVPHANKSVNSGHLTHQGYCQAQDLAHWILKHPNLKPDIIIANSVPNHKAFGSLETCEPIAHDLKIHINNQYLGKEAPQMATDLLSNSAYSNKRVLICWDQHMLEQIALALGAQNPPILSNKQQGYLLEFDSTGVKTNIISPYQTAGS